MKSLRWLAVIAGLVYTAVLCCFCIADVVAAGQSAEMGWQVLGLDPRTMALHQMWLLSARIAVSTGVFSPEITLNALSAIYAGAALSGVVVVFYRLLACSMSGINVATLFLIRDDEPEGVPQQKIAKAHDVVNILTDEFSRSEKRGLVFGTIAAGMVFAFFAPLWVNATRAGPASFDILLVLLAVWTTSSFCLRPSKLGAFFASAVGGVGLAESPLFIAVGVVLTVFYMRTVLQNDLDVQTFFLIAVGSICGAFMLQLGMASFLLSESREVAIPITHVVRLLINGHYKALLSVPTSPYWMWTLLWAGIPFVIALSLSLSAQSKIRVNYMACMALGSISLALVLFNFPYTPWWVWRGAGEISIITSLMVVFASGFLACRWWLLSKVTSPRAGMSTEAAMQDIGSIEMWHWFFWRSVGVLGVVTTVVVLVWLPWQNWCHIDPQALQAQTETEHDQLGPLGKGEFEVPADADVVALLKLALEMLDKGMLDELEQVVMPRLSRVRPPIERDKMELLRARILMARGGRSLESARIFFLRLLQRDLPEQADIARWLLETDLKSQDWNLVERDAQTIRKILPDDNFANEMLARAVIKRGAPRLAVGHLQQVLLSDTNAMLLTVLGEATLRIGDAESAMEPLKFAISLDDASGDTFLFLAMAYKKSGNIEKALATLDAVPAKLLTPELVLYHAEMLNSLGMTAACREKLGVLEGFSERLNIMQRRQRDALLMDTVSEVLAPEPYF